jgi:hypothetical protein
VCTYVVDRNRSPVIAATSDAMPNEEASKAVLDAMVRVWEPRFGSARGPSSPITVMSIGAPINLRSRKLVELTPMARKTLRTVSPHRPSDPGRDDHPKTHPGGGRSLKHAGAPFGTESAPIGRPGARPR